VNVAELETSNVTVERSGCGRFGLPSPVSVIDENNESLVLNESVPVFDAGQLPIDAPSTVIVQVSVALAAPMNGSAANAVVSNRTFRMSVLSF
jgi:hypothetical protein